MKSLYFFIVSRQECFLNIQWRRNACWLLLIAILNLLGCVSQVVSVSPQAKILKPKAVAILPFNNDHQELIADAFQAGVIRIGWPVIERSKIKAVLNESEMQAFLKSPNSSQSLNLVQKLLKADVIIIGKVTIFQQGRPVALGGGNTMFGFTARAIEVSTGLTLWSVSVVDDGGMFSFWTNIQLHAIKRVDKVVDDLVKQGVGTN
jgi:Curli production assembly/transport component CsgG